MVYKEFKKITGQEAIRQRLIKALQKNSVSHALLFCGPYGYGTFAMALEVARAVLCESVEERPCYECKNCKKIDSYSHPDFHILFALDCSKDITSSDSSSISQTGWDFINKSIRENISAPYLIKRSGNAQIPIDWIRETNAVITRGAVQGGMNVVIIADVDTLQSAAANAMLKTLEEPPANTLMILLAHQVHAVLPTIKSRCQIYRFGIIPQDLIAQELAAAKKISADDTKIRSSAALAQGSLAKAFEIFEDTQGVYLKQAHSLFLLLCSHEPWFAVLKRIEFLIEEYHSGVHDSLHGLLSAMRELLRFKLYSLIGHKSEGCVEQNEYELPDFTPDTLFLLIQEIQNMFSAVRSRVNGVLLLTMICTNLREIVHGKECQIG